MLRFSKAFALCAIIVFFAFFMGYLSEGWCSQVEWQEVGPGGGGALRDIAFDPDKPDRVYITSDMVGVFVSNDAGDHWKWSSYGAAKQKGGIAVDLSKPDILYTVGPEGIFQSTDKAKHWQLIYSKGNGYKGINNQNFGSLENSIYGKPGQSISVGPTGVVYVCTVNGDLIISRDKGETFKRISLGGQSAVRRVIPIEDRRVVAALYTDGVYLSRDEGITWENTLSSVKSNTLALAVHPGKKNVLYALTSKRSNIFNHVTSHLPVNLYRSIDGGTSWDLVKTFGNLAIRKGRRTMDVSIQGTIIILLAKGPMRSVDGGQKWSYPEVIAEKSDGYIYAARRKWSGTKQSIYADNRKTGRWYMTGMGAALRSDDDGKTWYYKVRGLREQAYYFVKVNPVNPNLVIASDMDHGLIRSSDGGATWENDFIISPYEESNQLRFSLNDDTYRVLYAFFVHPYPFIAKSTDAGETWNVQKTWKDKKRRSMNGFCLTGGNKFPVMYVGEPRVGIWKSINEGKKWTKINKGLPRPEDMTYIQFLESDNSGHLYVGIGSETRGKGGIFNSIDGGETWISINKGLDKFVRKGSFEIDPNDPDVLWVSAGSAVYRSKDRGVNWEKRIEGIKSSAILVEPGNSDIIYVASFKGGGIIERYTSGIFKSVDGGNYFFEISGDLLRTIGTTYRVSDLEYGWRGSGGIWAAPNGGGLIYTIDNHKLLRNVDPEKKSDE